MKKAESAAYRKVSIQLISPASGDFYATGFECLLKFIKVSIQLISPASGDQTKINLFKFRGYGFHSINIPSEWGHNEMYSYEGDCNHPSFHSINIPSEWGPKKTAKYLGLGAGFPFN